MPDTNPPTLARLDGLAEINEGVEQETHHAIIA
jgi:hypothetical protein